MRRRSIRVWSAIGVTVALLSAVGIHVTRLYRQLAVPVALQDAQYIGSKQCLSCHPVHYGSWYRTFHRTMTQDVGEQSVLGDFNDASYTYEGIRSRFLRGAGGEYLIETAAADGAMRQFPVVRTVGSRRVQQYVTRVEGKHLRLPLAWNVAEKRWFHLNGGFLDPDGMPFHRHTAVWDANCIFCHNVKPNPAFDSATQQFNSTVAELGIACEACHGPGAKHAAANRNPLRRYLLHYSGRRDPTILSPLELPKERQVQICGHCHGQRLPEPRERIRDFVTTGDPYTPGDDLSRVTKPIDVATTLRGVDLSLRFWRDGTPRLTAYEYQGLLMSPDYQKGELTCLSCHTMHDGDPRGMILPAMRGNAACVQCHAAIGKNLAAHTRHKAEGGGSDCYACHMPKITYGLLDVHPTHRIQRPDPARAWRYEMPEACTLCHTNRTARWAAETMARDFKTPLPADLPTNADFEVAENVRQLLAGDVVQRSVAVMALADERSYTDDAKARRWVVPLLLVTMDDDYAAVRHFAYRALRSIVRDRATEAFPPFDPQAPAEERRRAIDAWRAWWLQLDKTNIPHPGRAVPLDVALQPDLAVILRLRAKQHDRMISIGE
jgi:predicted CXXCH cytochrome family protein